MAQLSGGEEVPFRRPRASGWFFYGLLAAAAVLAAYKLAFRFHCVPLMSFADGGEMLLHGLRSQALSYAMPGLSLLEALMEYHSRTAPEYMYRAAGIFFLGLVYVFSYLTGLSAKGRWTGALALLTAVVPDLFRVDHEFEQVVYSAVLMLAVLMLVLRNKEYGLRTSLLAGLAVGFTFLVRSPLFLLPVFVVGWDYFQRRGELRKFAANSAVFLLASYFLLVPWARVNYGLFGRLIPFEEGRASCNIVTSVKGATFTTDGDAKSLAGIGGGRSVYGWAAGELAKNPFPFLAAVPERLLQVFYMYPFLILASLLCLIGRREKEPLLALAVAGYFVVIHCFLSIEKRYFDPLPYLLAFPAAAGFKTLLLPSAEEAGKATVWPKIIFYAVLLPVAAVEWLLLSYPARALPELPALNAQLQKFPSDRWLLKWKGRTLLNYDMTPEGRLLFEAAWREKPGSEALSGYILETLKARGLGEVPEIPAGVTDSGAAEVKLLKELQLGGLDAARGTYSVLYANWFRTKTTLRTPVTRSDFRMLAEIEKDAKARAALLDFEIYKALYWFPPEARFGILSDLEKITPLTGKLKLFKAESGNYVSGKKAAGLYRTAAAEFNYFDSETLYLTELLTLANGAGPCRAGLPGGGPLAPLDRLISEEIGRGRAKEVIDTFQPDRNSVAPDELRGIVRLFEAYGETALFRERARELRSAYPANVLYGFIYCRLALKGLPLAEARDAVKKEDLLLARNYGALLRAFNLLFKNGEAERAAELFGYMKKVKTGNVEFVRAVSEELRRSGDYKEALSRLSAALRANPGAPALYNDRGVVLRFMKRDAPALEDFKAALRLNPAFDQAELNAAAVLLAEGRKSGAKDHYARILSRRAAPESILTEAKKGLARAAD